MMLGYVHGLLTANRVKLLSNLVKLANIRAPQQDHQKISQGELPADNGIGTKISQGELLADNGIGTKISQGQLLADNGIGTKINQGGVTGRQWNRNKDQPVGVTSGQWNRKFTDRNIPSRRPQRCW